MTKILTIPNILSLLRVPLALVFVQGNPLGQMLAIFFAGITDWLDGYLARKYQQQSRFGTILDPVTDKIFVFTALFTLYLGHKISIPEAIAMLSRDLALLVFAGVLILQDKFQSYRIEAFLVGKIFTTLQLLVLLLLVSGVILPPFFYLIFVFLGAAALIELYQRAKIK